VLRERSTWVIAAAWPVIGGVLSVFHHLGGWNAPVAWTMIGWLEWSALTPAIIAFARCHPIDARARTIAIHIGGGIIAGLLHLAMYVLLEPFFLSGDRAPLSLAVSRLTRHLLFGPLNYAAIVVADRAFRECRRARGTELALESLSDRLASARFEALRLRFGPELLQDALGRLQQLVRINTAEAAREIYRLSRSLREALDAILPVSLPRSHQLGRSRPAARAYAIAMILPLVLGGWLIALRSANSTAMPGGTFREVIVGWLAASALAPVLVVVSSLKRALVLLVLTCIGVSMAAEAAAGPTIFDDGFTLKLLVSLLTVYILRIFGFRERHETGVVAAAELERRLSEAKLEALRVQLEPHFLFNTLNSILVLVERDPRAAETMIERLRRLFDLSLSTRRRQEVTLREELNVLANYVEIERMRFGNRLRYTVSAEPSLHDCRVPSLLLQPLVENAIRHGIARRAEGGRVDLRVTSDHDSITIEVQNDGGGFESSAVRERIGLSNIRARLALLYASHEMLLSNAPNGGVLVRIRIPFRKDEAPPCVS
jgi:hypothetical protein